MQSIASKLFRLARLNEATVLPDQLEQRIAQAASRFQDEIQKESQDGAQIDPRILNKEIRSLDRQGGTKAILLFLEKISSLATLFKCDHSLWVQGEILRRLTESVDTEFYAFVQKQCKQDPLLVSDYERLIGLLQQYSAPGDMAEIKRCGDFYSIDACVGLKHYQGEDEPSWIVRDSTLFQGVSKSWVKKAINKVSIYTLFILLEDKGLESVVSEKLLAYRNTLAEDSSFLVPFSKRELSKKVEAAKTMKEFLLSKAGERSIAIFGAKDLKRAEMFYQVLCQNSNVQELELELKLADFQRFLARLRRWNSGDLEKVFPLLYQLLIATDKETLKSCADLFSSLTFVEKKAFVDFISQQEGLELHTSMNRLISISNDYTPYHTVMILTHSRPYPSNTWVTNNVFSKSMYFTFSWNGLAMRVDSDIAILQEGVQRWIHWISALPKTNLVSVFANEIGYSLQESVFPLSEHKEIELFLFLFDKFVRLGINKAHLLLERRLVIPTIVAPLEESMGRCTELLQTIKSYSVDTCSHLDALILHMEELYCYSEYAALCYAGSPGTILEKITDVFASERVSWQDTKERLLKVVSDYFANEGLKISLLPEIARLLTQEKVVDLGIIERYKIQVAILYQCSHQELRQISDFLRRLCLLDKKKVDHLVAQLLAHGSLYHTLTECGGCRTDIQQVMPHLIANIQKYGGLSSYFTNVGFKWKQERSIFDNMVGFQGEYAHLSASFIAVAMKDPYISQEECKNAFCNWDFSLMESVGSRFLRHMQFDVPQMVVGDCIDWLCAVGSKEAQAIQNSRSLYEKKHVALAEYKKIALGLMRHLKRWNMSSYGERLELGNMVLDWKIVDFYRNFIGIRLAEEYAMTLDGEAFQYFNTLFFHAHQRVLAEGVSYIIEQCRSCEMLQATYRIEKELLVCYLERPFWSKEQTVSYVTRKTSL